MKKKLLISFILVFAFLLGISISSYAKELDEIQDYEIKVDLREDGVYLLPVSYTHLTLPTNREV